MEIPAQKRIVRMCETRKRWWGAPGYRVPTVWRHGNRGTCKDLSRTRCTHEQLIQHMHSYTSVASGLYLRSVRFRGGSSRCDVEEVVVHGVIVEVVVLTTVVVHGRRGSSGTHCLVESTATVVVHSTVFGNVRRTRFIDVRVFRRGTGRIPDV